MVESRLDHLVMGGLIGLGLGLAGMTIIVSAVGPSVHKAKIFREENKPAVIWLYTGGITDQILVESLEPNIPEEYELGEYAPQDRYLGTIMNEENRNMEEARIREIVRLYEE